jgi:hypothetical protein
MVDRRQWWGEGRGGGVMRSSHEAMRRVQGKTIRCQLRTVNSEQPLTSSYHATATAPASANPRAASWEEAFGSMFTTAGAAAAAAADAHSHELNMPAQPSPPSLAPPSPSAHALTTPLPTSRRDMPLLFCYRNWLNSPRASDCLALKHWDMLHHPALHVGAAARAASAMCGPAWLP